MLELEPALHHEVICNAIDDLLNDEYDELIILAPPGSAKSTYTSIAAPSYFLGRNPKGHVLTASYSTELAEKWGRRVRNTLDSDKFNNLFNVQLSKDSTSAGRWATAQGGEFYAAGVGSGILGFRADFAIIDDPISGFEEAQSMTRLAKIHGWYETDLVTRLKPQAKLVLICQRLARNDLAGYLIDRNAENPTRRQKLLMLPMLAGEDDVLGRTPGERLWPEWFTDAMVQDAQRDEFKWKTLYQQEPPADTGAWVSPEEIQFVDIAPQDGHYYVISDLALSVNSGDFSVHLVASVNANMDVTIVDAWRKRVSPEITAEAHVTLCDTYHPKLSLIDDDNAAKVYVQLLARQARESGVPVPWKALPMRGQDKETRAAAIRGWFKRGKMYLLKAEWNKWLVTEILGFPNLMGDGVDDGIDCLSLLGRHLAKLSSPAGEKSAPPPSKTWQDVTLNEMWEDKQMQRKNRRL
jgi:predicted phage terminase large subunit-like protein